MIYTVILVLCVVIIHTLHMVESSGAGVCGVVISMCNVWSHLPCVVVSVSMERYSLSGGDQHTCCWYTHSVH